MCTVLLYCLWVNVYCTAVLFVWKCVLYCCHRVSTQLRLKINKYIYITWPTSHSRAVIRRCCISSNMHGRFSPVSICIVRATFVWSHGAASRFASCTVHTLQHSLAMSYLNIWITGWTVCMIPCPLYTYKHDPALWEMKILLRSAGKRMVDEIHSVADVTVYRFLCLHL
jgi:hypothetical protein